MDVEIPSRAVRGFRREYPVVTLDIVLSKYPLGQYVVSGSVKYGIQTCKRFSCRNTLAGSAWFLTGNQMNINRVHLVSKYPRGQCVVSNKCHWLSAQSSSACRNALAGSAWFLTKPTHTRTLHPGSRNTLAGSAWFLTSARAGDPAPQSVKMPS